MIVMIKRDKDIIDKINPYAFFDPDPDPDPDPDEFTELTTSEEATSLVVGSLAVDEAVTVVLDYKYFKKLVAPVVVSPQVYKPTTFKI